MLIEDTARASRKAVIELLGISVSHFQALKASGVFQSVDRGQYDLVDTIKRWSQYHADGRAGGDMAEEKRLLVIAQRKKIEQDMRERSRELVPLGEAQRAFNETMVLVASQLDGLPGRVAGEVAGLTDPAEVRGMLFDEVRRIRHAAATKLENWADSDSGREPISTATTEDSGRVG